MKSGESKADTVRKVNRYIGARLSGGNKQESAIQAGYAESTARNPTLLESTKTYQVIVEQILTKNATTLHLLAQSLYDDAVSGVFDELKPLDKAQLYKIITDANDKLTPKVTVKQTTDAKGNKTSTAWGTNGSLLHDALGN